MYSTITVHGTGFQQGMSITLSPVHRDGRQADVYYDSTYVDSHTINLSLRPGYQWPVGVVSVTSVNSGPLGVGNVQIAEFLAKPTILSSSKDIYVSKVREVKILLSMLF